jgi:hypothetical protein
VQISVFLCVLTLRFPGEGALGNLEFGREVSEVRKISVLVVQQLFYTIKPKQKMKIDHWNKLNMWPFSFLCIDYSKQLTIST